MVAVESHDSETEQIWFSRPETAGRVLDQVDLVRRKSRWWKRIYRLRVISSDALAIIVALALAQLGRFGLPADHPAQSEQWLMTVAVAVGLGVVWLIALGAQQSWDLAITGTATEEYRRVVLATVWVFGIVAALALIFQLYAYIARGFLLIALPAGLAGLLFGRYLLRRRLCRRRSRGESTANVVVLGNPDAIVSLSQCLGRSETSGYKIMGACLANYNGLKGDQIETSMGLVPILGGEQDIESAISLTGADTLAITATEVLGYEGMRTLAWRLDALNVDMIVVPGMDDIAGPRLKLRTIDNLPLFHIERARHDGPSRFQKRIFDVAFGLVALIVFSPVMIAVAIAIKASDPGPALFRQKRVGYRGVPFTIFKFRTMSVDSEAQMSSEQQVQGQSNVIFYKSASDSRITPVGRFLRKTSIDELPQLFNVIAGTMSIVGPRPLVPGEGKSVKHFTERRALVKPGLTGLWQVSGRSDASAEERIRLDHSYIDNWSFVTDLVIVWRTAKAVLARDGAY